MAAFNDYVDLKIEFGFGSGPFASSPTWTDVSTDVKAGTWVRGRSSVQSDFPAGSGTLWLDNTDGDYYPWNTSGSYSPDVTVGVPVRITASITGATGLTENANDAAVTLQGDAELVAEDYPLFYGYVSAWPTTFPTNAEELVSVQIVERIGRLAGRTTEIAASLGKTDLIISSLILNADWPSAARDLDDGVAVARISLGDILYAPEADLFEHLRFVAQVEQGHFFQAKNGDARFINRTAAATQSSQATFGPDDGELAYVDVTVRYDDDGLQNEAVVIPVDWVFDIQTASDSTSVTDHGARTALVQNPWIRSGPDALNVAEWIVGRNKDVRSRIVGMVVDPAGDPALWGEVLERELRDVITVEASYPGSAVQLSQDVAVELMAHSFDASGSWVVEYGLHPLSDIEQNTYWVLGTSDDLDTDTILA